METRRPLPPSHEERKAMVKQKLAMRGLEQRKIYDSADASMNKSAMDRSKGRAAGGMRDQNAKNRPSLQRNTISRNTKAKESLGLSREPSMIGQKVAARGNQQAAEHGSLSRTPSKPTAEPAETTLEKTLAGEMKEVVAEEDGNSAANDGENTQGTMKPSAPKFSLSRSPLDVASLLSNVPESAKNNCKQVHIKLPTVGSGDKEITVNTNTDSSKLLDAASLLKQWNAMKASHMKPEAKSSLSLAVMAQTRAGS